MPANDTICDCGHDEQVHSETDPKYCETCGGKCRVGGFRTWQRQIDELRRRIETLEAKTAEPEGTHDEYLNQKSKARFR